MPRVRTVGRGRAAVLALLAGALAYALSLLVAPPATTPNEVAGQWQRMSEAPFAFAGPFPHRMLAPLLAHCLGLGGARWILFTQLSAVLLLSLVFHVARLRGGGTVDALLVAIAAALTGAIQTYKGAMAGYVDDFGYALSLITWLVARHSFAFWGLILLNLTNHEMVGFFVPWFLFVRRQAGASLRSDAIGLAVVGVLYVLYRQWVAAHAPDWTYDGGYFLTHSFLPTSFLFLWLLAAVHLLQMFGPLLAIVVWHALRERPDHERLHTGLIVAGLLAIFCFAWDVNRHSNMILLPLIVASGRFLGDRRSRLAYVTLILATVLTTRHWDGVLERILGVLLFDCGGHLLVLPEHRYDLGLQWRVLLGTVERCWPTLLELAAGSLCMFALALWLARRAIGDAATATPILGRLGPAMPQPRRGSKRRNPRVGS